MVETNPFTVMTFIAAPAVLTNASSLLALGTSNRFARMVDRARALAKMLEEKHPDEEMVALWNTQLDICERRCGLLVRAMKAFYTAVGSFSGASVVSLFGATLSFAGFEHFVHETLVLALVVGAIGFIGLVFGGALLVHETSLTLEYLKRESAVVRRRSASRK